MATADLDALRLPEQHLAEHNSDPARHQRGYIRATDYSLPYASQWSRLHHEECSSLLRHVNCSYLSTHGRPPTLLALKQHAQALCSLILMLVPTVNAGEVDAANAPAADSSLSDPLALKFLKNDAFDFLNDLRTPYTNDDPDHQLPLNSLANEVRSRSDLRGTEYHCALADSPQPRAKGAAAQPYANHHSLLMHANACLERLDHEFGAEGGLMAVLPRDDEVGASEEYSRGDIEAARNTLLGQWLGFTQHLVRRTHELEIAYGNALDLVQADAVLPLQALGTLGPDGRSAGRQVVAYPQDRWVLANAGDDTFAYVHKLLDAREAVDQEKERMWREQGVSAYRMWRENKAGDAAARGIVAVNVGTRYYRLAGRGHGTVFVVPGWDANPAVDYTRLLEKRPGVVGVPVPKWPERASEMEKRIEGISKRGEEERLERLELQSQAMGAAAEVHTLTGELERLRAEVQVLEEYLGEDSSDFARDIARMRAAFEVERERYRGEMEEVRARNEALEAQLREQLESRRKSGGRRGSRSVSRQQGEGVQL